VFEVGGGISETGVLFYSNSWKWSPPESTPHVGQQFAYFVPAPCDYDDGKFGGMMTGREEEVLGENLPQRHFVHHKYRMT
jgi:hypothetical protein